MGQNVLSNQLNTRLSGIPGITPEVIADTGATELVDMVSSEYRGQVLEGYNESLRVVFLVALCMACIGVLCALPMEWLSVKKKKAVLPNGPGAGNQEEKGQTHDPSKPPEGSIPIQNPGAETPVQEGDVERLGDMSKTATRT